MVARQSGHGHRRAADRSRRDRLVGEPERLHDLRRSRRGLRRPRLCRPLHRGGSRARRRRDRARDRALARLLRGRPLAPPSRRLALLGEWDPVRAPLRRRRHRRLRQARAQPHRGQGADRDDALRGVGMPRPRAPERGGVRRGGARDPQCVVRHERAHRRGSAGTPHDRQCDAARRHRRAAAQHRAAPDRGPHERGRDAARRAGPQHRALLAAADPAGGRRARRRHDRR